MDPALWLLAILKLKAFLRKAGKTLRTAKGIGLTLVGLLVFVPWAVSLTFAPAEATGFDPATVRRFGPLVLLGFAVLTLLLSTGERALFFSPAEIAFLFSGPFTRRGLLAYKVVGLVWGVLFSSIFMLLAFLRASRNPMASYLAIVLMMLFFQFFAMAVGLASSTVAVLATGFRRRFVLGFLLVLAAGTLASTGIGILDLPPAEALRRVEASPILRAAVAPLKPFVLAYAAERTWPDLVGWGTACLAMVAAMVAVVFAIDTQYMEAVAASSSRMYAKLQRMQRGGVLAAGGATARTARLRLGMFPWWGGVGPTLWRQMTTALREPIRVAIVAVAVLLPAGFALARTGDVPGEAVVFFAQGFALWMSIFLSPLIAFDFRGDLDRMEGLKSLPIAPAALAIGEVLTPVLIFAVPQWVGIGLLSIRLGGLEVESWGAAAMVLPATFLLFGIENLLFLLFPTRSIAANPGDFAAFGRQILLILGKVAGATLTIGAAVAVKLGAEYLLGVGRSAATVAGVAVAFGFAASLVPLLAFAFERYDVARDTPA